VHELYVANVADSYPSVLRSVIQHGQRVETRGFETLELQNYCVTAHTPDEYIIWSEDDPRHDYLWSEIETVQSGEEPEFTASSELDTRLDLDDGTFYEDVIRKRISADWEKWIELLTRDHGTRKATSQFGGAPDSPCTSRVQWMIRADENGNGTYLHCFTYNRSQDLMFAYPMDVGVFGHYHHELAEEIDAEIGRHEHVMTSAHIYREQLGDAKEIAFQS